MYSLQFWRTKRSSFPPRISHIVRISFKARIAKLHTSSPSYISSCAESSRFTILLVFIFSPALLAIVRISLALIACLRSSVLVVPEALDRNIIVTRAGCLCCFGTASPMWACHFGAHHEGFQTITCICYYHVWNLVNCPTGWYIQGAICPPPKKCAFWWLCQKWKM